MKKEKAHFAAGLEPFCRLPEKAKRQKNLHLEHERRNVTCKRCLHLLQKLDSIRPAWKGRAR